MSNIDPFDRMADYAYQKAQEASRHVPYRRTLPDERDLELEPEEAVLMNQHLTALREARLHAEMALAFYRRLERALGEEKALYLTAQIWRST